MRGTEGIFGDNIHLAGNAEWVVYAKRPFVGP
jgi:hypothetical protein